MNLGLLTLAERIKTFFTFSPGDVDVDLSERRANDDPAEITKKINGEIITIGALILNQQQMPQVYHDYLHKYLTEELADRHNDILFFSDDSKQAQEFEECRKQLRNPYNVMLQHGSDFKPYLFN